MISSSSLARSPAVRSSQRGEAFVQLRSRLLGDPEVGGVANQDVAETEAVLLGKDRGTGLDELLPRQRHEARSGRSPLLLGRELGDRTAPELLANHGGAFDHGPLLGLEAVEAGSQECMDRRRNREIVRGRPVLRQHREHLLDVERVALCGLGDLREEVCGRAPSPRSAARAAPRLPARTADRARSTTHSGRLRASRDAARADRGEPCRRSGSARRESSRAGTR